VPWPASTATPSIRHEYLRGTGPGRRLSAMDTYRAERNLQPRVAHQDVTIVCGASTG
jgi:hypothetical protein